MDANRRVRTRSDTKALTDVPLDCRGCGKEKTKHQNNKACDRVTFRFERILTRRAGGGGGGGGILMDGNQDAGRSDSCITCQRISVVEKCFVLFPLRVKLSSVVSPFNSSASSPKHTWDREPSFVVCACVCEEVSPDVAVLVFGLDEGSSRSAKDSPVRGEGGGRNCDDR